VLTRYIDDTYLIQQDIWLI